MIQMLDVFLHTCDSLDARAPCSKNGNAFVFEIIALLVIGRMHDLTLGLTKPINIGHLPAIEHATSVDEEHSRVFKCRITGQVADLDMPDALDLIPVSAFDNMPQLDLFVHEIAFLLDLLKVLPDLP